MAGICCPDPPEAILRALSYRWPRLAVNLLKTFATVSGLTLLSRVLGLAREVFIAHYFGARAEADAFNVAFRLPNLLRRLFAEGAFSQAFVPVLADYKNNRSPEDMRRLIDHVATLLGLVVLVVTLLGVLCAPWVVSLTAGGFEATPDKFALTVELTRITFPYILFISLTALTSGVLNTWSRFAVPAFTPSLLNLAMIGCLLLAAPWFERPVFALAIGTFLGGILQLGLQLAALARLGLLPRFSFTLKDEGVNRVLKLMAPAILGVSVAQISLIINTAIASRFGTGAISWLNYADRLMEFPNGLLGVALGTILLPSLAKLKGDEHRAAFSGLLDWGLRLALLLTVPATVAIAVLAVPLVSTLLMRGAFTATDVLATEPALIAYTVGLCGIILVKILAPAFYSRQDVRTPVRIALTALAFTQLLNLGLVIYGPLKHEGLALSISLAALLNAGLLFFFLRQRQLYAPAAGWPAFLGKLGIAVAVMAVLLLWLRGVPTFWFDASETERLLRLGGLVVAGAGGYFGTLLLLGFRPRDFRRRVA